MREAKEHRECVGCGSAFIAKRAGPQKYCSQPCAAASIGKVTMPANRSTVARVKLFDIPCENCGVVFQAWKSAKRKFCSSTCSGEVSARKSAITKHKNGWFKSAKPYSKGKASWCEIGGQRFYSRSTWEANYARYLEFQKEHGLIVSWEHEPHTFWFEGIKRGVMSYLPDFKVTLPSGKHEWHEVKGWMDKKSITKIKRMKRYYPNEVLVVIDDKRYRALAKTVKGLVKGWTSK